MSHAQTAMCFQSPHGPHGCAGPAKGVTIEKGLLLWKDVAEDVLKTKGLYMVRGQAPGLCPTRQPQPSPTPSLLNCSGGATRKRLHSGS